MLILLRLSLLITVSGGCFNFIIVVVIPRTFLLLRTGVRILRRKVGMIQNLSYQRVIDQLHILHFDILLHHSLSTIPLFLHFFAARIFPLVLFEPPLAPEFSATFAALEELFPHKAVRVADVSVEVVFPLELGGAVGARVLPLARVAAHDVLLQQFVLEEPLGVV